MRSQFILPFSEEKLMGPFIVGFVDVDMRFAGEVVRIGVRVVGVDPFLAGGDAVPAEPFDQQVRLDALSGEEEAHDGWNLAQGGATRHRVQRRAGCEGVPRIG